MKDAGVKIEKVEVSKRLTDSPVVVVTSQFGYSAQQEKVMKAQAFQNKDQLSMMAGRKTLEINPNHPVIADLLSKVKATRRIRPLWIQHRCFSRLQSLNLAMKSLTPQHL